MISRSEAQALGLNGARGVAIGLPISVVLWGVIALIVWSVI
jgi:tetrahydromethanopterin S-methyltransferase subunit F